MHVGGEFTITVDRGGVALSTREVFNNMTTAQYFAAFVYWTQGFGDSLAESMFDETTWSAFRPENPDGFYLRGQLGYGKEVKIVMGRQGVDRKQGKAIVDAQIKKRILENLPVHLLTTLPVFYRGIWIDEYIIFSLPCLIIFSWIAFWRRQWENLLVFWPGLFSLVFYALISLNIPRYQMVAIPALSFALALGIQSLVRRYKKKIDKY